MANTLMEYPTHLTARYYDSDDGGLCLDVYGDDYNLAEELRVAVDDWAILDVGPEPLPFDEVGSDVVGNVHVEPELEMPGEYMIFYGLGRGKDGYWGHRGVMRAAVLASVILTARRDNGLKAINFGIRKSNYRSQRLAAGLGAAFYDADDDHVDVPYNYFTLSATEIPLLETGV